jgi:hypothetical protein
VLSTGTYDDLQAVTARLVWGALALLFAVMIGRVGFWPALVLTLAIGTLTDTVAVGQLPMQAVSFAVMLAGGAAFMLVAARWRGVALLVAAGLAGALYNFFDFFCNPECLAAICAWGWAASAWRDGRPIRLLDVCLVFAAVMAGYTAFWAAKWGVAAAYSLLGGKVYLFNGGDLTRWTPVHGWIPGAALVSSFAVTFAHWWKAAIALALAVGVFLSARHITKTGVKLSFALAVPLMLGFLFNEAVAEHTLAHPGMSYRIVPLSLALLLASVLIRRRQITPDARNAEIDASS